jgi:DNA-binding CsgD family transcriptional regulator
MATGPQGSADRISAPALECIQDLLGIQAGASARTYGLSILCQFGADLVKADAGSYIDLRGGAAEACWCAWSRHSSAHTVLQHQRENPVPAGQEWWIVSVTRRRVYDKLGAGHLAELPLRTSAASPSLMVLKRQQPFEDSDSEALARSRSALLLIEALVDRLFPWHAAPSDAPQDCTVPLTAREHEVLEMLSEGLLARSIAARLEVSERTVHKHLGSLYRKLDAHDRLLAVRRAQSLGMLHTTTTDREAVPGVASSRDGLRTRPDHMRSSVVAG